MTVPSLEWFRRLQESLDCDVEYLQLARWLLGPVLLRMGDHQFTVYFHKGRIVEVEEGAALTGTDFVLAGSEDVWQRLLRGEIDLAQALSPAVGWLRLEGNVIEAAGNMRPLHRFIQKMREIPMAETSL